MKLFPRVSEAILTEFFDNPADLNRDAISDSPLQFPQFGISEEEAIALLQTETDIGVMIDRLHKAGYTPVQIMELFDRIGW